MPIHLTPEQSQLRVQTQAQAQQDLASAKIVQANATAAITEQQNKDTLNLTYQNYWDGIIASYEQESRKISGVYITTPFSNTDVVNCAAYNGRLYKPQSGTAPFEIPELTGGGATSVDPDSESAYASQETATLPYLNAGFNNNAVSETTMSDITASSTSFMASMSTTIVQNDILVISGSGHSCILMVTSVVPVALMPTTINFTFLSTAAGVTFEPSGTVPSGSSISGMLAAFTDSERATKIASDPDLQDVLTQAILSWSTAISNHENVLNEQLTAVQGNQDDNLDKTVAGTLQTDISNLSNYLLTTDVSDVGLTNITTLLSTRAGQAAARLAAIPTAKTPLYPHRYNYISLRCDSSSGSLTLAGIYQQGATNAGSNVAAAQAEADSYET